MAKIFISPNLRKQGIVGGASNLCGAARTWGKGSLPTQASVLREEGVTYLGQEEGIRQSDAMVVLGGDGTILRIAALAARMHTPILGVNLGHVGFMTELEPGEIADDCQSLSG